MAVIPAMEAFSVRRFSSPTASSFTTNPTANRTERRVESGEHTEIEGRVEGDVAIVTGARTGIGRATTELLAAEDATVTVPHHEENGAQETVESIRVDGGEAVHIRLNVQSEDDWRRVVAHTCEEVGCPTILVNDAGDDMVKPSPRLTRKTGEASST
jgi:hypothetical protein